MLLNFLTFECYVKAFATMLFGVCYQWRPMMTLARRHELWRVNSMFFWQQIRHKTSNLAACICLLSSTQASNPLAHSIDLLSNVALATDWMIARSHSIYIVLYPTKYQRVLTLMSPFQSTFVKLNWPDQGVKLTCSFSHKQQQQLCCKDKLLGVLKQNKAKQMAITFSPVDSNLIA